MRIFKNTAAASAAESAGVAERLRGIVDRVQAQQPVYPDLEDCLQPDGVRQRFWTPQRLEQASNDG